MRLELETLLLLLLLRVQTGGVDQILVLRTMNWAVAVAAQAAQDHLVLHLLLETVA